MPRKPEIDRPIKQIISMPESIHAWLHLHLFSKIEGRAPQGAISNFFLARLREYREDEYLDLAPYVIGLQPGVMTVRGSPEALAKLRVRLEEETRV